MADGFDWWGYFGLDEADDPPPDKGGQDVSAGEASDTPSDPTWTFAPQVITADAPSSPSSPSPPSGLRLATVGGGPDGGSLVGLIVLGLAAAGLIWYQSR